jgi:DNA-binding response OmpR family regulator
VIDQEEPGREEEVSEPTESLSVTPGPSAEPGREPIPANKVVLVVEDDLDTADSLKVRLENNGYRVITIFDGLQALETARRIRPGLVILDVMVPGLMGYHVCRLLKFDERYRKIPVIMLTGKVDKLSREMGTKAGADLYITKPFEMSDLVKEVARFIG